MIVKYWTKRIQCNARVDPPLKKNNLTTGQVYHALLQAGIRPLAIHGRETQSSPS